MAVTAPPSRETGARAGTMSHATVALALALLLGIQPVATDLYLPTLPLLKADLGASMHAAQRTLAALMLAFGLGQLMSGPLADRHGRRPVLLVGLTLYTVGSALAALAPNVDALIVWRALQGLGVAACVVCARAMVRDLYEPAEGVRVLSLGMSGLALIALLGPPLGALLAEGPGWRAAMWLLTAFGAATLAYIAWRIPETVPQRNLQATQIGPLLRSWGRVLRHPTFVAYALLTAGTYAGLYTYLSSSSFILMGGMEGGQSAGLSRLGYSLVLSAGATSYLLGTFGCRRWLVRHGIRGTVKRAAWLTLSGGLLVSGLHLAGISSPWAIVLPMFLYTFAHGVHQSCGQAGVVAPFPAHAGAASALSGFILCAVAFGIGHWLGGHLEGSVRPLTLGLGVWALFTATIAWTLVQRHGEPVRAAGDATP